MLEPHNIRTWRACLDKAYDADTGLGILPLTELTTTTLPPPLLIIAGSSALVIEIVPASVSTTLML